MKKQREIIIIIENPTLKKLRSNLRTILKLSYYDQKSIYRDLKEQARKAGDNTNFELFSQLMQKLDKAYDSSLLECRLGAACISYIELLNKGLIQPADKPTDLNMIRILLENKWYCEKCYNEMHLKKKEAISRKI